MKHRSGKERYWSQMRAVGRYRYEHFIIIELRKSIWERLADELIKACF